MKSIFEKSVPRQHLERNAFDLSENHIFSASSGMILPCMVKEVNPNEHFEFHPTSFLRTMPLNTAAFTRLKQYVDFYYVPFELLMRQFPQLMVNTSYPISSISQLNKGVADSIPFIDIADVYSSISSSTTDLMGYSVKYGALRLLDLLGYGVTKESDLATLKSYNLSSVNPLRLLAYQKIYSDYYRVSDYEVNDPTIYNIDAYVGSSIPSNISARFLQIRYRNWRKDYFTCVLPDFQSTDYMTSPVGLGSSFIWDNVTSGDFLPGIDAAGSEFSVANIRAAYALDKMYRLMSSAKDGDYRSQIFARYGYDVKSDPLKSSYLGGISAPVTISEVITTANTQSSSDVIGQTGDIYGKGVSANNSGTIEFDVPKHGIIMAMFSVVPDLDYCSFGIDNFNKKKSFSDYFQPEFADLGRQPVAFSEFNALVQPTDYPSAIGWQPRYSEYKTAINKVHGPFVENGSLSSWCTPRNSFSETEYNDIDARFFKVNPNILNPVMVSQFDGSVDTDTFLVDFSCQCSAIRPMSVDGQPLF